MENTNLNLGQSQTKSSKELAKHFAVAMEQNRTLYDIYNKRVDPETINDVLKLLKKVPEQEKIQKTADLLLKSMHDFKKERREEVTEEYLIERISKRIEFASKKVTMAINALEDYKKYTNSQLTEEQLFYRKGNTKFTDEVLAKTIDLAIRGIEKSYTYDQAAKNSMPIHVGTTYVDEASSKLALRVFGKNKNIDINTTNLREGQTACVFGLVSSFSAMMDTNIVLPIKKEFLVEVSDMVQKDQYVNNFEEQNKLIQKIKPYADIKRFEKLLEKIPLETNRTSFIIDESFVIDSDRNRKIITLPNDKDLVLLQKERVLSKTKTTPMELWEKGLDYTEMLMKRLSEQTMQNKENIEKEKTLGKGR